MKKLICVIDVQNDFIDGTLRNEDAIKVVPNIVRYLEENIDQAYVVATYDTHFDNYLQTQEGLYLPVAHCIEGTTGHAMNKDVKKVFDQYDNKGINKEIKKLTFGANPNDWVKVIEELKKQDDFSKEIEFLGFCTDICVVSNALLLKALYPELKMTVLENLCAGVTKKKHASAIEVMKSCQILVK